LSINGKTIEDIINIFLYNLTADGSNISEKDYIMNNFFNDLYFDFIDDPVNFSITYKMPNNDKTSEVTVPAASKEQVDSAIVRVNSKNTNNEQYYQTFESEYAVLTI